MKFSPIALLLSANSLLFAGAALHQNEGCGPRPEPIRDIKFTDLGGESIHNYSLHGEARIEEPAPGDVPRALRIDSLFSYALLEDLDISPSNMKDLSISIGVYIESIRPAADIAPDPLQNESYGWVLSHDNGGFDRAIFLHDERFNGIGITSGKEGDLPNAEYTIPPLQKWIQIIAVWRQGEECDMYIDSEKHTFSQSIIAKHNEGLKNVALGAPEKRKYGKENDNDLWIKDVKVFGFALDEQQVEDMKCNFDEDLKPNIDCGAGDLVFSCTECAIGDATGCAGDCMWNKDLAACVDNDSFDDISCGDHDASDCSQCDVSEDGTGCSGECKFAEGECRPFEWEPPIDESCPTECHGASTNIALLQETSQSSDYKAHTVSSVAVDGDKSNESELGLQNGVSFTGKVFEPWWKVDLGGKHYISQIVIYNREHSTESYNAYLSGFNVDLYDGDDENSVWTYVDPTPKGKNPGPIITIPLDCCILADRVKVSVPGKTSHLVLREVEVFGTWAPPLECDSGCHDDAPTNIAVGKRTSQSSDYGEHTPSSSAADGDTRTEKEVGHQVGVSLTQQDYEPWWKVHLGKHYISEIVIYNRESANGSWGSRLSGFRVDVYDGDETNSLWKYVDQTPNGENPGSIITIPLDCCILADTVKVSLPGKRTHLVLREVEVYGTPAISDECDSGCHDISTNVALGKGTSQSGVLKTHTVSSIAVDGDKRKESEVGDHNSVVFTGKVFEPWWKVDLGGKHYISRIVIYNRKHSTSSYNLYLQGFNVDLYDGDDENSVWTYVDPTPKGKNPGHEVIIDLDCCIPADMVKVSVPGKTSHLVLREVEVYGTPAICRSGCDGDNVALGKVTSQSSNYKTHTVSSIAVDGDTRNEIELGQHQGVILTKKELSPWWKVDLGAKHYISQIVIYDREVDTSSWNTYFKGFRVDLYDGTEEYSVWTHVDQTPAEEDAGKIITLNLDCCILADTVKVSLPGKATNLVLREVEVYGTIASAFGDEL